MTPVTVRNVLFIVCLVILSIEDWKRMIIPDRILIVCLIIWFGFLPWMDYAPRVTLSHILAGIVYFLFFLFSAISCDYILGANSLGGGDIKLYAVAGLYLGWISSLYAIFFSCIFGILLGGIYRKLYPTAQRTFPFGPAIALSCSLMLLAEI